jgi:deoxyribonuclease V
MPTYPPSPLSIAFDRAPTPMRLKADHPWTLTPAEARALQRAMADQVVHHDFGCRVGHVAGIDVGFEDQGRVARAAVAVLGFPALTLVDAAVARAPVRFPYVPGLLSFREIPVVLKALARLRVVPDLILCDGHGYSHPRRFGLACHLGVITGVPTIGVGKTLLCGVYEDVPDKRGAWVALCHEGERIGAALRSRVGVKPIYVSVGHRTSLSCAVAYVMRCVTRYRLPETTRHAHRLASSPAEQCRRLLASIRKQRPTSLPGQPLAR